MSEQPRGIGSIFISLFSILHSLATFLFVRKPFPFSLTPIKVWIPPATRARMEQLGVTEQQVMQVFHHGKLRLPDKDGARAMTMLFGSQKVGIYYRLPTESGEYRIVAVWKDQG